ncbi:MAG: alanine dehydrogenase [Thaumarchaeota archaeon]|nr:alanine dehydrogenase [Candidatus Calditenuaceae archaeon]MDW8186910.1 alanine dehydrogenase [Nitrososphaerota archaeon]
MKVLLLKEEDVRALLTMREAIEAVEMAYREKGLGRVQMPPKSYLYFEEFDGDLRVMPSYLETIKMAGVKLVNSHPFNQERYGLPTVMAIVALYKPEDGRPLAIMGGAWLTAMRTGAGSGVATKYLARRGSRVVAIVGAGTQARTQLMAMVEVLNGLSEVRVYDRRVENARSFAEWSVRELGVSPRVCESPLDCVKGADVLCTTTPSRTPIVMAEWISAGTHINAIGADAPGKQELDPRILKSATIFVDDLEQAVHSGEVNVPIKHGLLRVEDIRGEIGEVVAGKKPSRIDENEVTVYDSTGLAILDLATGELVYRKAVKEGVGTWVEL